MKTEPKIDEEPIQLSKRGFLLDTLIQGFIILLPLSIILLLLSFVFNFIFKIVSPISSMLDSSTGEPHWSINFLSLGILILFIFLIGAIIRNRLGKFYFSILEKKYLSKVPLYSMIQQTVLQFVGLKKLPFSEVVLIDPFQSGTLMTGFITDRINENLITVFVPTAPNPANGNIYHVPKDKLILLDVTTQDAMKTIMGMGTGSCSMLAENQDVFNTNCSEESKNQLLKE
ncbi:DUF502 domain-containing protein [Algoriphagus vanfongensis]|uniref:DUF502 domain-containing protein n=1 Tax=Algoriphagus vanfongensis TaxID=426371 RepID=UPI0004250837|nr:DUF502 domain-containing protein [Algoriphagus vanfongensis]